MIVIDVINDMFMVLSSLLMMIVVLVQLRLPLYFQNNIPQSNLNRWCFLTDTFDFLLRCSMLHVYCIYLYSKTLDCE